MGDDVIEEFQVVVAGDTEYLGDAEFGQAVQEIVTDGVERIRRTRTAAVTRMTVRVCGRKRPPRGATSLSSGHGNQRIPRHRHRGVPGEILDVIADLESVTEWSPPHQSAEVLERDKDGRPSKVKMKVKAAGITDEQVVAYTWSKNKVSWTLVSSGQQRAQDASYTLTPDGDKTKVKFDISVDPVVPLPGFVLKRAIKGTIDTGTKGLRERVLR